MNGSDRNETNVVSTSKSPEGTTYPNTGIYPCGSDENGSGRTVLKGRYNTLYILSLGTWLTHVSLPQGFIPVLGYVVPLGLFADVSFIFSLTPHYKNFASNSYF